VCKRRDGHRLELKNVGGDLWKKRLGTRERAAIRQSILTKIDGKLVGGKRSELPPEAIKREKSRLRAMEKTKRKGEIGGSEKQWQTIVVGVKGPTTKREKTHKKKTTSWGKKKHRSAARH